MALFLSGIFPGLGQLYNRQPVKGAFFLVGGIVLSWLFMRAVPTDPVVLLSTPPATDVIVLMCVLLAIWIWSVIDAVRHG
jgi:hypothetical protein